jgi:hypothetical protein
MLSVGSAAGNAVGMTDDETLEQAIAAELAARVDAFGGINAYTSAYNLDKRNFGRYLVGKRTPTLPQLMRHLANLNVEPGDFFDSVNKRVEVSE